MFETAKRIRGIHPGKFLERELKKRKIPKGKFSADVNEYPQTLVAITKGKRRMNAPLALRIEKQLQLEDGLLMVLQALYDMEEEKKAISPTQKPTISRFRATLFWETDLFKMNWELQKRYIIRRVMQRGNKHEQQEIIRFYGPEEIQRLTR